MKKSTSNRKTRGPTKSEAGFMWKASEHCRPCHAASFFAQRPGGAPPCGEQILKRRTGRWCPAQSPCPRPPLPAHAQLEHFTDPEDLHRIETGANGSVFVKLMLPSHVTGGYWLQVCAKLLACLVKPSPPSATTTFTATFSVSSQAPLGLSDALPIVPEKDKFMVTLDCGGEEWDCVFLSRPGGNNAGLSGGWRGFAIDQRCGVAAERSAAEIPLRPASRSTDHCASMVTRVSWLHGRFPLS